MKLTTTGSTPETTIKTLPAKKPITMLLRNRLVGFRSVSLDMKITGRYNKTLSWEKQSVFNLSNGWTAVIEYNNGCGIDFVKKLSLDGQRWLASDGLETLPAFAEGWLDYWYSAEHRGLFGEKSRVAPQFDRLF